MICVVTQYRQYHKDYIKHFFDALTTYINRSYESCFEIKFEKNKNKNRFNVVYVSYVRDKSNGFYRKLKRIRCIISNQ